MGKMETLIKFNSEKLIFMRVIEDDIEILNSPIREGLTMGSEEREYFVRKSQSKGFFNFYHPSGVYRCDSDGKYIACMEITDLVEENERNKKLVRRMNENYENMLHFSDLVIHDVKNYMLILEGFLDLMKDGDMSEENIEGIEKAISKIKELVNKTSILIRDSSKIRKEKINLEDVISDVFSRFKMKIKERNIAMEKKCKVTEIFSDAIIEEAIHNLVSNAVEHTPSGGKVSVECLPSGSNVKIIVRDTGPGVPEELKDVIFERFRTSSGMGMGLGLAVAKHVAELLGGRIWVEDNEPRGAAFIIEIPKK